MHNKILITLLAIFFILMPCKGQKKSVGSISGIVKEKSTGEALPYATIIIDGTTNGTTANIDGHFTLFNLPEGEIIISVQFLGYMRKNIKWNASSTGDQSLIIELEPESKQLNEVVVTGQQSMLKVSDNISQISVSPKQLAALPGIGEKDIFRSLQLLPGISGTNESSSGLYVRGGTPDQNLILYDGFTVYHVDHFYGFFSAFNANAIKDVQLYKGGFEPKFGGRTSSVVEITGKTGNEHQFNIGGEISSISANAFTEIPLPVFFPYSRHFSSISELGSQLFERGSSTTSKPASCNNLSICLEA